MSNENIIAWDDATGKAVKPRRFPNEAEWARWPNGDKRQYFAPVEKEEQPEVTNPIRRVSLGDVILTLPKGTRRKLQNIVDSANYNKEEEAAVGDTADTILMYLVIGKDIDVNSKVFDDLFDFMISQESLGVKESHREELKNLPKQHRDTLI